MGIDADPHHFPDFFVCISGSLSALWTRVKIMPPDAHEKFED